MNILASTTQQHRITISTSVSPTQKFFCYVQGDIAPAQCYVVHQEVPAETQEEKRHEKLVHIPKVSYVH